MHLPVYVFGQYFHVIVCIAPDEYFVSQFPVCVNIMV